MTALGVLPVRKPTLALPVVAPPDRIIDRAAEMAVAAVDMACSDAWFGRRRRASSSKRFVEVTAGGLGAAAPPVWT